MQLSTAAIVYSLLNATSGQEEGEEEEEEAGQCLGAALVLVSCQSGVPNRSPANGMPAAAPSHISHLVFLRWIPNHRKPGVAAATSLSRLSHSCLSLAQHPAFAFKSTSLPDGGGG